MVARRAGEDWTETQHDKHSKVCGCRRGNEHHHKQQQHQQSQHAVACARPHNSKRCCRTNSTPFPGSHQQTPCILFLPAHSWYEDQSGHAWGPERPSLQETRTHAKCLRTLSSVRDYFRDYRAKKKHVSAFVAAETVSSSSLCCLFNYVSPSMV